jgi:hypothetical protein
MEMPKYTSTRLAIALGAYLILFLIATFALEGALRTALWIFLVGLAVRTIIAARADADE